MSPRGRSRAGHFSAECPPIAVLTSNRSRDLHDAPLRASTTGSTTRPDRAAVRRTVLPATAPLIVENATHLSGTLHRISDLRDKPPGVVETIDWVAALVAPMQTRRSGFGSRSGQPWGSWPNA